MSQVVKVSIVDLLSATRTSNELNNWLPFVCLAALLHGENDDKNDDEHDDHDGSDDQVASILAHWARCLHLLDDDFAHLSDFSGVVTDDQDLVALFILYDLVNDTIGSG